MPEGEGSEAGEEETGEGGKKKQTTTVNTGKGSPPPDGITTVLKLVTVPVNVAITPIMQNARIVATEEWGWQPNMSWEDFFDTCLFLLCRSLGYMLKGYYKVDKEGNPIDDGGTIAKASSTPSGTGGNGEKKAMDYEEDELLLGIEIAKYLKKNKLGKEG